MPKKLKQIELPLLKEITDFTQDILRNDDKRKTFRLPDYIKQNLKHTLRDYQTLGLYYFNYTQKDANVASRFNQLLFHMATGSGKTDMMATLILYMYREFGYQNFLFVVNTNAVIAKTRENLINASSSKYLFHSNMTIDGQNLILREVKRFPKNQESGLINIRLSTVQTLTNELSSYRENGLTYDDLSREKMVILADEAHHFNASTKSEKDKEKAWENVINRVRQSNPDNRQFEFTATIDLQNDNIYQKYRDKIVYQYDLLRFQNDGYSKKIRRIQANNDDTAKMLNAILLSQFRKAIARDHGIPNFKPVILFKSNKIEMSKLAHQQFIEMIDNLTAETLADFISSELATSSSETLKMAYKYFSEKEIATLVVELKRDFASLHLINVNDNSKSGIADDMTNFKNLNTLEEPDNPFRVIFAVAKLSEGWDVLNLYDIVRIGEQAVTLAQTNSEAQLIGRGARYNPFSYEHEKSFRRRFDKGSFDLSVLETLHYHTIAESKYLDNLRKSLDNMQLQVEDDSDYDILSTKVKEKFKKTDVYQNGKLYYNLTEEIPDQEWDSLAKYGVPIAELPSLDMTNSTSEVVIDAEDIASQFETRIIKLDERLLKKGMARNSFFRFDNLKRNYLPTLTSMAEFRTSENWLGKISVIQAKVSSGFPEKVTREFELATVEKYLAYIQRMLVMNYKKQRGTNNFESRDLHEVITDYEKRVSRSFAGSTIREKTVAYDMKSKPWFVHEDAIVDGLEYDLINLIEGLVEELQEKYEQVYLLRNDERANGIKLFEFDTKNDERHYQGFMPDFILYLENQSFVYQLYLEPKGEHLLIRDAWKENLLTSIRPEEIEILGQSDKIKLYGVKFYLEGDKAGIREEVQSFAGVD